ncbi:MAG: hypothetical protein R3B06_28130 [Kofleriaceae bacterium]
MAGPRRRLLAAGVAHADRREASVHVQPVGGRLSLGEANASAAGAGGFGGLAVRASYATANLFQYDAQVSVLAGTAAFDQGRFVLSGSSTPIDAPFTLATQAVRLDAGATVRLGVRWIPTVRVAAGVQAVRRASPAVEFAGVTYLGADTGQAPSVAYNLVATATVGLDYRVTRRWIIGAAIGAAVAAPGLGPRWDTLDLTAHLGRYWYPRW